MTKLGRVIRLEDIARPRGANTSPASEKVNGAGVIAHWDPDSIVMFIREFDEPVVLSEDSAPKEVVDFALSVGVLLTTDGHTIKPFSDNPLPADLVGAIRNNRPLIIKEIQAREDRWRYELTHYLGVTSAYLANKGVLFWRDAQRLWATCPRETGDALKANHPEAFAKVSKHLPEPVTPGTCVYYQPDPVNPEAGGGKCKCNGLNGPDKYTYPMKKIQCSVYKPAAASMAVTPMAATASMPPSMPPATGQSEPPSIEGEDGQQEDSAKVTEGSVKEAEERASQLVDTILSYGVRISTDGERVIPIDGVEFGEKLAGLIDLMQPDMALVLSRRQAAWLDSLSALISEPWNNHLEPDDVMTVWHTPVEVIAATIKGAPVNRQPAGAIPHAL